ncbi:hypothetical protein DL546_007452 [Coniochaeta pulveracea]|uniref:polynucleotide adenylyltransferase n=1 Tax=Coniochaeta pulveracea TaxID=177199 RepID=A0A420YCK3_9PEZI|nr:hypothetical protein DL546_007452 [Coniochaeta pulveracea]
MPANAKKQPERSPKQTHSKASPATNGASRPAAPNSLAEPAALSSSVPSTPHQRPRKFSFDGSREPSPGTNQNHSPRSVYSETNSTLPSLRPLPPRLTGCRLEVAPPTARRRMNYSIGTDKLDKVDPEKIKSELSEHEEQKLTRDMRELYDRLLPSSESERNRLKLVKKLERIFNDEWPGHDIQVHLFGSSGNLLCSDDSDVDICITTEWTELECVCMIAELLNNRGMEKVVCVAGAKVPIVKIWDPELKLNCDMNVNNVLALENTRMVRTYVQLDERVRPLAMVIKHWTRRRIINDAAFGGTLSSYTWICLIIAFLQLRKPPVLPALHQRQEKLPKKEGEPNEFADDVEKLRSFGKDNEESLGALLFHFFKFYAHEFDYDKYALSIRLGKLITKTEKKWHLALNNCLCVEEPFNTIRNLGNTADDTSFRGLHLELRRAFDLIAEGKLDECCEQYEFPKEEVTQFSSNLFCRPAAAPRPVLVRSSSQSHSNNRGGRGGWRGNGGRQYRNGGGNSSRRASSVIPYDVNSSFPGGIPSGIQTPQMTAQEANQYLWMQAQQQPMGQAHLDIFGGMMEPLSARNTHPLQLHYYTQQHFLNQTALNQQALQVAQRLRDAQNAASHAANGGATQSTDRSRTNSFDNPPLTAPIRPDMTWVYPYPTQPGWYGHAYTTYPSSPSTTTNAGAAQDFRRSLHRSTVTSDSGAPTGSGSLRSQSQPASRTTLPNGVQQATSGYMTTGHQGPTSASSFAARQANGGTVPHLMAEQTEEGDFEVLPTYPMLGTPPEDEGPRYVGYFINGTSSPVRRATISPINGIGQGIPMIPQIASLGVTNQERRRPSAEQNPQSILDKRLRRTSRSPSPSPLGQSETISAGTSSAPLGSSPFPQLGSSLGPTRGPLVVNGTSAVAPPVVSSSMVSSSSASSRQSPVQEPLGAEDVNYGNPLHINQGVDLTVHLPLLDVEANKVPQPSEESEPFEPPRKERALIVNGSTPLAMSTSTQSPVVPQPPPESQSFNQRLAMLSVSGLNINAQPYHGSGSGVAVSGYQGVPQTSRSRANSRHQHSGIASLDLATSEFQVNNQDHLSPVFENQTSPSRPTRTEKGKIPPGNWRKLDATEGGRGDHGASSNKTAHHPHHRNSSHSSHGGPPSKDSLPRNNGSTPRENGHTRNQKSESDHSGGWQKQKSRKKAGVPDPKHAAGEQLPKNEADRKGG